VAPSLGDKAALWFVGLAMAFIVLALTGHDLDGWAFNITTESLGIAATVLVIGRILRVEEHRRRSPRVDYMGWEFGLFLGSVASDFAITHREGAISPYAFDLLDGWLADHRPPQALNKDSPCRPRPARAPDA